MFQRLKSICFLGLVVIITSCNNSDSEKKEAKCEYEFDNRGLKNGEYKCYFDDGILSEKGYLKNDTVRINERCIYFPSGKIKEYKFYNVIGVLRYSRRYDEQGNLLDEQGDFFSHEIVSSSELKLGDSVVIDMYIAHPPNCSFTVFDIDKNGRYNLKNRSKVNFMSKHIIQPDKTGTFVFLYEVDFIDSLTQKEETRKDKFTFEVK